MPRLYRQAAGIQIFTLFSVALLLKMTGETTVQSPRVQGLKLDMSDDDLRIAVAEACGAEWRVIKSQSTFRGQFKLRILVFPALYDLDGTCDLPRADGTEPVGNLHYIWKEGLIPDYPKDLNAIHDAIMDLTEAQRKAMRFYLYHLTDQMTAHNADARTRCFAFLAAVGKLEEIQQKITKETKGISSLPSCPSVK